mgnify:CR=1 FL=1
MGLIDDKRSIFTEVGAYISVQKNIKRTDNLNTFSSVNNKKEPIPFMLDLITVTSGSEAVKGVFGKIMTKYIREVTPTLKDELKKLNTLHNSDTPVSGTFTTTGFRTSAKNIDVSGKFNNDPSNGVGKLLYGDNVNDFDRKSYDAIANPNTDIAYGSNMTIRYDELTDEFVYKGTNPSMTKGDFINNYIDNLTLIDEKELNSKILDSIYGNISSKSKDNTLNTVFELEKYNKALEKLLAEEENIDVLDSELEEILKIAEQRYKGKAEIQIGCCDCINASLDLNDTENLISVITGSSDPTLVGDLYERTIDQSVTDPSQQELKNINKATIKDGFFKRLINNIVRTIMEAITSTPQIRALQLIVSGFKNNGAATLDSPINELKKNRNTADCLAKTVKISINKFIFDLVKKELLKIVSAVSVVILREKINQFIRILRSLIS